MPVMMRRQVRSQIPTFTDLTQLFFLRQEIELNKAQLLSDAPGNMAETIKSNMQRCVDERDRLMSYITAIPESFTRQIFTLKFVEGMQWKQVAASIGGGNSADAVLKRASRYATQNPLT